MNANNAQQQAKGLAASHGNQVNKSDFTSNAQSILAAAEHNDVLLTDAILVDGISAAVACARNRHFRLDYSQYIQLINSTYCGIIRQNRSIHKHLSLSQYTYYCEILLWKRLKYVLTARGDGVNEYEALRSKLPPMVIPEKIGHYLNGIGNIVDYNGRRYYLSLQDSLSSKMVLGIPGHYGRVNEVSHINYETLPSPFVSVLRLLYDLAVTNGLKQHPIIEVPLNWDLPEQLAPRGNYTVNRNLLGWSPAVKLTDEQVQTCNEAGLSASVIVNAKKDAVPSFDTTGVVNFMGLPIVYRLLLAVSELLACAKSNQATYYVHAETTSTTGSIAIVGFNERNSDASRHTGSTLMPIYEREATGLVYSRASIYIMSAISLFRYRVKRVVHGFNDSLCYTGAQGEAPPGWPDTADDIYNTCPYWNLPEFRTTCIKPHLY